MTGARAQALLKAFEGHRVLIVGDLMLDRYVRGTVSRISPEAPVPVVRVRDEAGRPGGAANVALNVQSMGGTALVAGFTGCDAAADELCGLLEARGIDTAGVTRLAAGSTTVKTRVVADRQQIVRIDHEAGAAVPATAVAALCETCRALVPTVDGVIVEDYGKGVVSQVVVDTVLRAAAAAGIPTGLDPKECHELDFLNITLATPNYREALGAAGFPASRADEPADADLLAAAGARLLAKWGAQMLIITLGPEGMYLCDGAGAPRTIPTVAREVFDVSGAGDTVIAVALLGLAAGASFDEAAALANRASGIVVGKLGTAVCTRDEVLASME